jgi:hypothetical protein
MLPPALQGLKGRSGAGPDDLPTGLFSRSILVSEEKTIALLRDFKPRDHRKLEKDPAYAFAMDLEAFQNAQIIPRENALNITLDSLYRIYTAGMRLLQPDHNFFRMPTEPCGSPMEGGGLISTRCCCIPAIFHRGRNPGKSSTGGSGRLSYTRKACRPARKGEPTAPIRTMGSWW